MNEHDVDVTPLADQARELREKARTVLWIAADGALQGLIGVADPIKDSAPEAIRLLRKQGLRIVLLTGDNQATAEAVAKELGIDEVRGQAFFPKTRPRQCRICRTKDAGSPWLATG